MYQKVDAKTSPSRESTSTRRRGVALSALDFSYQKTKLDAPSDSSKDIMESMDCLDTGRGCWFCHW